MSIDVVTAPSQRKRRRPTDAAGTAADEGSGSSTANPNVVTGQSAFAKVSDVEVASRRSKRSRATSSVAHGSLSTKANLSRTKQSPSRMVGSAATQAESSVQDLVGGSTRARRMVQAAQAIPAGGAASAAPLPPILRASTRSSATSTAGVAVSGAPGSVPIPLLAPLSAGTPLNVTSPGRSARLMPPPPTVTPAGTGKTAAVPRPVSGGAALVGSSRAQRALAAAQAQTTAQSSAGKVMAGKGAPGTAIASSTPSRYAKSSAGPASRYTPAFGPAVAKALRMDEREGQGASGGTGQGNGRSLASGVDTPAAVDDSQEGDSPSSPRLPSMGLGLGLGGLAQGLGEAGVSSSDTSFSVPLSQHIREGVTGDEEENDDTAGGVHRPEPQPHPQPGGTVEAGGAASGRSEAAGASVVDLVQHHDPTTLVTPEQQLVHAAMCAEGMSVEECRRVLRAWHSVSLPSAPQELLYYACQHAASTPCEDGLWAGKSITGVHMSAESTGSSGTAAGRGSAHPEDECYMFILMDGHGGAEMMNFGLARLPALVHKYTGSEGTVAGIVRGLKTAFAECDTAFLQDIVAPLYAAERAAHAAWKSAKEPSSGPLKTSHDKARYALHLRALAGACTQVVLLRKAALTREDCVPHAVANRKWMIFTASAGDVRAVLGTTAASPSAIPRTDPASSSSSAAGGHRAPEDVLLAQLHREEHGLDSADGSWKTLKALFVDSKARSKLCPPAVQQWPDACGVPEQVSLGAGKKGAKDASGHGTGRSKVGTDSAGGSVLSPGAQGAATYRAGASSPADALSSSSLSPLVPPLREDELEEIEGTGTVADARTTLLSGSTLAEGLAVLAVVDVGMSGAGVVGGSSFGQGGTTSTAHSSGGPKGSSSWSSSWASKGAVRLPSDVAGHAGVDAKSMRILPSALTRSATHARAAALVQAGKVVREMGLTALMKGAFSNLRQACRLAKEIPGVLALSEGQRQSVYVTLEVMRARRAALAATGLLALPLTVDHTPLHPHEYRAVIDRATEPVPIRRLRKGPLSADLADRDKIAGDMPYQVKGEELKDEGLKQWKSENAREGSYVPASFAANPLRVAGSLAVTRALGDWYLKVKGLSFEAVEEQGVPYITPEPDVTWRVIQPGDSFLIMACDGVWDVLRPAVAVELVASALADDALTARAGGRAVQVQDRAGTLGASTSDGERAGTLVGRSSADPASSPSEASSSLTSTAPLASDVGPVPPTASTVREALLSSAFPASAAGLQPVSRPVCSISPPWNAEATSVPLASTAAPEPTGAAVHVEDSTGAIASAMPYVDISVLNQLYDVSLGTPAQRLVGTAVLAYQMLHTPADGGSGQDKQAGPRRYWETAHADLTKRYEELVSLAPKPSGPPQFSAPSSGYRRQKHDDTSALVAVIPAFMALENAQVQEHGHPVGFLPLGSSTSSVVDGLDGTIHPPFLRRWATVQNASAADTALLPHYEPFDFSAFIQRASAVLDSRKPPS